MSRDFEKTIDILNVNQTTSTPTNNNPNEPDNTQTTSTPTNNNPNEPDDILNASKNN